MRINRNIVTLGILLVSFIFTGCLGGGGSDLVSPDPSTITAPVLSNLVIADSGEDYITLQQPTLSTAGNPTPTVNAYIGVSGVITVSGSVVSNAVQGPIDVSSGDYQFTGLSTNTDYKIIVVAENSEGYSVKQIVQSTTGIAPVLNNLAISSVDTSSITLQRPTFSTAGNPAPTVNAYIGVNGTITVSGSVVTNAVQGPFDVSSGDYQFTSLSLNTDYKIIVVAENSQGYSVKQIIQSTASTTPILNSLVISSYDSSSITLEQPTFSSSGNPTPTVNAYIGINGLITVSGSTVSGSIIQGPIDVSSGDYQFVGLNFNTNYKIIVIAENYLGYSVEQKLQLTANIAPILNNLVVSGYDSSSITLQQPTFSTAGNPTPTVNAYIGLDGVITVSGSIVSNAVLGPIDVSSGDYQFTGLSSNTDYKIIVVAENNQGYSVKQKLQSTTSISTTPAWTHLQGTTGPGTQTWGTSITSDSNNNTYVTGSTNGSLDGQTLIGTGWNFFVIKYDSSGTKQWTRLLGVIGSDTFAYGITSDSNNNVYVVGTGVNSFVTKYDSSGNKLWTKLSGASGTSTSGSSIATDSNDNIYITGSTSGTLDSQPLIGTGANSFVTKYDSSGNKLWTKLSGVPGSSGSTSGNGITTDSNNNIYITGTTTGSGSLDGQPLIGIDNFFVIKYDTSGIKQWTYVLGSVGGNTTGIDITSDSNNNVYAVGRTFGGSSFDGETLIGINDSFITKYSSSGTKQWTYLLGATGLSTWGTSITSDSNNNFYVTGQINGNFDGQILTGGKDFFVTKYNINGSKQWTKLLGAIGAETMGSCITSDSNNNVYITGQTHGNLDGQTLIGTGLNSFVTKYTAN